MRLFRLSLLLHEVPVTHVGVVSLHESALFGLAGFAREDIDPAGRLQTVQGKHLLPNAPNVDFLQNASQFVLRQIVAARARHRTSTEATGWPSASLNLPYLFVEQVPHHCKHFFHNLHVHSLR